MEPGLRLPCDFFDFLAEPLCDRLSARLASLVRGSSRRIRFLEDSPFRVLLDRYSLCPYHRFFLSWFHGLRLCSYLASVGAVAFHLDSDRPDEAQQFTLSHAGGRRQR